MSKISMSILLTSVESKYMYSVDIRWDLKRTVRQWQFKHPYGRIRNTKLANIILFLYSLYSVT